MKRNEMIRMLLGAAVLGGLSVGCVNGSSQPAATAAVKEAVVAPAAAAMPHAKPGFFTRLDKNGRLWVFAEGSKELEEFKTKGESAKVVIRPGAGPGGITLKGADADTLRAYVVAAPGFHTQFDKEGRLWVFKTGATELADYQAKGELAKHVVRPAAGPMGLTLKGPDATTLDEYQAQF